MEKDELIDKIELDCPFCDRKHIVEKRKRDNIAKIKNKIVKYEEVYFLCTETNEEENEFVTSQIMDENLLNARDTYRRDNNLLTSQEIKGIRKKYNLTQSEFSYLLGLGEVTITRYETKLIQDETYDKIMRLIDKDSMLALDYLENNKDKFTNKKRLEDIENNIKTIIVKEMYEYLNQQEIESKYINFPLECIENGYKVLDIKKIEDIINYISKNYNNLYKVKLMKLLWYIDVLSYKENNKSITGLVYMHQRLGALPIAFDELMKLKSIKVEEEINEFGDNYSINYHILPNEEYCENNLTEKEKNICDKVIRKFKSFTTKQLVEYMHNEKAYKETKNDEIIDFKYAKYINF